VTETAPAEPILVVRREFPMAVKVNGQALDGDQLLVVLTTTTVYVWKTPGEAPLIQAVLAAPDSYALRGTFEPPSVPLGRAVTTAGTIEWTKGKGCGCHHPLQDFRPFPAPTRQAPRGPR
jgi:hypothetical protein